MRKSRLSRSEWVEIGLWSVVVLFFFGTSFEYDRGHDIFKYGTAAWPRVLLILMALAIIGQVADYLSSGHEDGAEPGEHKPSGGLLVRLRGLDRKRVARSVCAFVIPLVYVVLLPGAGFYVLTPFFIVAYIVNFGEKRFWPVALTTVGIYVALAIVFTRYLYVGLPLGNWPGFHYVGAAIVNAISAP